MGAHSHFKNHPTSPKDCPERSPFGASKGDLSGQGCQQCCGEGQGEKGQSPKIAPKGDLSGQKKRRMGYYGLQGPKNKDRKEKKEKSLLKR
jgi:hypothetical protein